MQKYELTTLVKTSENDNEALQAMHKIYKLIEDCKGEVIINKYDGRKKLSYPIKDEEEAYFIFFILLISAEKMNELVEKLYDEDYILRFLIVKAQ